MLPLPSTFPIRLQLIQALPCCAHTISTPHMTRYVCVISYHFGFLSDIFPFVETIIQCCDCLLDDLSVLSLPDFDVQGCVLSRRALTMLSVGMPVRFSTKAHRASSRSFLIENKSEQQLFDERKPKST
ncbi:uncharacterized protein HD556DRAFT_1389762 [Suillus plorans]|uniref:Uncharacterized protein n=1 Tax=Suillus plorans TaxID=116603 RepID=A0A9P7AL72_9AGAM|nr:uncharacterized protein HD556DRAFT_1389762 [Suillus plorans]KAG1790649.1 hypothetical protein HD556DRAFT_1389762 [Suillus plorans]